MASIKFQVDGSALADTLTWEDLEAFENRNYAGIRKIIAKFLIDALGRPVPYEQAMKQLGSVKLSKIKEVADQFMVAFNDSLLNPTTGSASSLPSNPVEAPLSGGSNSVPPETGA